MSQSDSRLVKRCVPDSGFGTPTIAVGIQISGATTIMPLNPSRETPTILNGCPFK